MSPTGLFRSDLLSLLAAGSHRAVADLGVGLLNDDPVRFRVCLGLCFEEPYPISMRAARVVQLASGKNPALLAPYLEEVIPKALTSSSEGVRRSFLKVLGEAMDLSVLADPGFLVDRCFTWLMDPSVKPAIRIYAMDVIYKVSQQIPDLQHELKEVLLFNQDDEPPSYRVCARRLLKKISS